MRGEPPCYLIAHFSAAGRYLNSARLDDWFVPSAMARFDNGAFLLVVRDYRGSFRDNAPKIPAIFDKDGHWVRHVRLSEAAAGFERPALSTNYEELDAIALQSADDGTIYLTRFSPAPAVFVVAPAGSITQYDLPDMHEMSARLRGTVINKGKLVALYETYQPDPTGRNTSYSIGAVCRMFDLNLRMRLPGFRSGGYGMLVAMDSDSLLYIIATEQGSYELRRASIP
jgi:hypothetical protein